MMADEHPSTDEQLMASISAAFDRELPPIPPHLADAARDSFRWRRVDAELAELLFDSAAEDVVGVRGTGTDRRSFRYQAGEFVVRVHLTANTLTVIVEPPLSVPCRVADGGEGGHQVEHRTDELGELVVDAPELPLRLELDLPSGAVVTPWIIG